ELRKQSVTDISKVQYAILETDGVLNVILIPAERPVTVSQMQLEAEDPGWPTVLISDGRLLSDNLHRMGQNETWLDRELKKRGISDPKDVYLLTMNDAGQIYFAGKEPAS
ncbi:MAG: DUF421 domain-containing protein, partial [Eubacteriales bacterium]|nr:DUF421 domain-containing protein [Eubacteriales bacterium]